MIRGAVYRVDTSACRAGHGDAGGARRHRRAWSVVTVVPTSTEKPTVFRPELEVMRNKDTVPGGSDPDVGIVYVHSDPVD